MSKLNYLEKLLDGVSVEWRPLWEVTIWDKKFSSVSREKQPQVINYPYLLATELFKLEQEEGDIFLLSTGKKTGWTTEELAGEYIREGEVVTIPWGKSRPLKDVLKYYKGRFVTTDNRITTSNNIDKLLNKFLYYCLLNQSSVIDGFYRGSGIQHPSMAVVLDLEIPIPPLKVQEEIVSILDAFTEPTAEFTAELTARQKQYNYYRDKLLTFEEETTKNMKDMKKGKVEWKTLGEVIKLEKGKQLNKELLSDDGLYPAYNGGVSYSGFTDKFNFNENTIIISQGGTSAGFVNFITTKFYANAHCYVVLPLNEFVNNRYLYHFLKLNQDSLTNKQHGAGIPALRTSEVLDLPIPIPPLKVQEEIVSILDKFTELTTKLTAEFTAELTARQKQYNYYREMLLSFPKENIMR
jgi:type I restriction enzyme S subunit